MLNPTLGKVPESCWRKLERLFADMGPPSHQSPIALHVGDPEHAVPSFMVDAIVEHQAGFRAYSPITGTPALREAICGWLQRRYGLPDGMVTGDGDVLPVAGLREAMFLIGVVVIPRQKSGAQPLVAIPDPFYHAYIGAATSLGAEPLLMPAVAENGYLPDFAGLPAKQLARLAAAYLCTPANPQGVAADHRYLKRQIQAARKHDFVLLVDECYADIYTGAAPMGVLEACTELGGSLDNVLAFHSLSKRSNVPGLRSGFAAGDARLLREFKTLRDSGGVAIPLPVQAASAALWNDDQHADESRRLYVPKFDAAAEIFGNRFGFYKPDGGMFLWLKVGDCEHAARELWGREGVKVMPGRYMSSRQPDGDEPGAGYLRVALVPDLETTIEALQRMERVLSSLDQ